MDNLRKRGFVSEAISNIFVLCGKEKESINHLFLHSNTSSFIW